MIQLARRVAAILLLCCSFYLACPGAGAQARSVQRIGKPVAMSASEKRQLDTFFSNFAEARVRPFKRGSLTDADLIEFGYKHNLYNPRVKANSNNDSHEVAAEAVDAAAIKYFGVGINRHHALPGVRFDGRNYSSPGGDGDPVPFAQIERLSDLGSGLYSARVNIYERAGDEDPADTHASPKEMARRGTPVTFLRQIQATIRRTGSGSTSRFLLLEQRAIERPHAARQTTGVRRCILPLRDAHGKRFAFSLICTNERTHIVTNTDRGPAESILTANMQPGQSYRYGHYEMALTPPGKSRPVIQDTVLYAPSGNSRLLPFTFQMYAVSGGSGDPDLLFWSNQTKGRGPDVSAFMIDDGRLVPVLFSMQGKPPDALWQLYYGVKFTRIGLHKYWEYWVMSARNYTHYFWTLDSTRHTLTLDQQIETRSAELPIRRH